jgi:hypothetical protein
MKGQVSFSRKVCTAQYENMSIGYQLEFDTEENSPCDVFDAVRRFVEDKIREVMKLQ